MRAPTTVAIYVCQPIWVHCVHHKAPNSGARHQEDTEPMSPKTQSTPPIMVAWAKGMLHPWNGHHHPQKPQGAEKSNIGCITRLLTRPRGLLGQTTTHPYQCPFTVKFLLPCMVNLDMIPSSARCQDRKPRSSDGH